VSTSKGEASLGSSDIRGLKQDKGPQTRLKNNIKEDPNPPRLNLQADTKAAVEMLAKREQNKGRDK
jgi:hypothetical protein